MDYKNKKIYTFREGFLGKDGPKIRFANRMALIAFILTFLLFFSIFH